MTPKRIDETMLIDDVLEMNPALAAVLAAHGLNCRGCPGAVNESLREAAEGHGIDLSLLLTDLNAVCSD